MGKNKMIAKSCPNCEMQVAVASKTCKCGHTFFSARRATDAQAPPAEEQRRRTSRVHSTRVLFDYLQFEKAQKAKKRDYNFLQSLKKRSLSRSIDEQYKKEKSESATATATAAATALARRRRALRRAARERSAPPGERARDAAPPLRPAQLATCALILQEINRKMRAVTWQPEA